MSIKNKLLAIKTGKFRQYLKGIDPVALRRASEKKVLSAFKSAARDIPLYRQILKQHNIDAEKIFDIYEFRRIVPVLDKDKLFSSYRGHVEKLCVEDYLLQAREIVSSSGHSGKFSFGINSMSLRRQSGELTDVMLDYMFNISANRTLLINALPMGIRINCDYLVTADCGPRMDTVVSLLSEFCAKFKQVIIIGDNNFIKNMLEEAIETGVDIKKPKIHLILGEEILAENMRSYLAYLLGDDLNSPDSAFIGSSFGIAELGLNLMFETRETVSLRRRIQRNKPHEAHPIIFHYFPSRIYIEEYKTETGAELVMTNCNERAIIPLIRYNTKDRGKIISVHEGLPLKLPVVELYDRDGLLMAGGGVLRPQLIREALFSDFSIAPFITGYFRLTQIDGMFNIDMQLKKRKEITPSLEEKINSALSSFLKTPFKVNLSPYQSFPYGMELDYERKFKYA